MRVWIAAGMVSVGFIACFHLGYELRGNKYISDGPDGISCVLWPGEAGRGGGAKAGDLIQCGDPIKNSASGLGLQTMLIISDGAKDGNGGSMHNGLFLIRFCNKSGCYHLSCNSGSECIQAPVTQP
jgi:hypothetical protein